MAQQPNADCESPVGPEERLRTIALHAIQTEQMKSTRLARFLHDEVAQVLSAVGLQLDILRMDLEAQVPEIAPRTTEIQNLLEQVVHRIRALSRELNPEVVERTGLRAALDLLVGRSRTDFAGNVRLRYDSSVHVPMDVAIAMHRIAEQAVENAIHHSECSQIEVIVKPSHKGPTLEVRDDGKGFDHQEALRTPTGLGLLIMDHYARTAGLALTITDHDGKGTSVRAGALSE